MTNLFQVQSNQVTLIDEIVDTERLLRDVHRVSVKPRLTSVGARSVVLSSHRHGPKHLARI